MTRPLRPRPALGLAAVLSVPLILGLSSCAETGTPTHDASTGRGQTLAELSSTLDDIEGLTFSGVGGSAPNVKGNTGFTVEVTLDPEYELADPPALITFLTEAAWSVEDGAMPNTTVEISYHGMPGDGVDLAAAAQQSGWVSDEARSAPLDPGGFSRASIPVAEYAVKQGVPETVDRLGEWPGDAPAVPEGLAAPREG